MIAVPILGYCLRSLQTLAGQGHGADAVPNLILALIMPFSLHLSDGIRCRGGFGNLDPAVRTLANSGWSKSSPSSRCLGLRTACLNFREATGVRMDRLLPFGPPVVYKMGVIKMIHGEPF